MDVLDLRSLLASAEGLLLVGEGDPEQPALDSAVSGLEIYQPGSGIPYVGRLVLFAGALDTREQTRAVLEDCRDATALIVPHDTPAPTGTTGSPLLLRRSPWVTTDALVRALVALTRAPQTPGDEAQAVLERDAALALHRQESALLALLQGTPDAATPAVLVGLRPDADHVVIAADVGAELNEDYRLALTAEFPDERTVLSERILFSVLPASQTGMSASIVERLRSRLRRAIHSAQDLPVAVGTVVGGVFALHESAASAREILRAMRIKLGAPIWSERGGARVAAAEDVPDALALIRAADALRSQGPALAAPLMLVAEYDREHQSELLPSVLAALEHRGNASDAARRLGIHANSLRARLERVKEISGVDLSEPVSAFRAMVAFLAFPEAHNTARRSR